MEEQKQAPPSSIEGSQADEDHWLSFKNQHEGISSKFQIKKSFYNEAKSNAKKIRSNKKNPTKSHTYYSKIKSGLSSPLHSEKQQDHIYQTAIPNTVDISLIFPSYLELDHLYLRRTGK